MGVAISNLTGRAGGNCGLICLATAGNGGGACDGGSGDGGVGRTNTLVLFCAGDGSTGGLGDQTTTEGGLKDGSLEGCVALTGGDGEEGTRGWTSAFTGGDLASGGSCHASTGRSSRPLCSTSDVSMETT